MALNRAVMNSFNQLYSRDVLKMSPISLNASTQPLPKPKDCLVDGILLQILPCGLQHTLELCLITWFRNDLLMCCQHQTPELIKRIHNGPFQSHKLNKVII